MPFSPNNQPSCSGFGNIGVNPIFRYFGCGPFKIQEGNAWIANTVHPWFEGDTNNDGIVDLTDLNNVRNRIGSSRLGDTLPFDGMVAIEDLNRVRNNFGATGTRQDSASFLL